MKHYQIINQTKSWFSTWPAYAAALGIILGGSASAATITTNVATSGAIVDTSANYNASYDATHVIDGKIDEKQTSAVSYWLAPDGAINSSFILDLRQGYAIKSIVLYNTHNRQFNDRGTGQFQLYASDAVQSKAGAVDRYYSFDGDVTDRSANNVSAVMLDRPVGNIIDGTYSSDVATAVKSGKSISFTGAGERVEIVDAPGSSQPTAYTLSIWVKFQGALQPSSLVVRTTTSGRENSTWSHQLRLTVDNQFQHYTFDGGEKRVTGTTVVQPNVWYHVAATAQNSGQARLYVNGVEEGTALPVGTLWTGGGEFALATGSGHGMLPSALSLDELGIWFSALPADLIKRLSNGEKPNTVNNSTVAPTGLQLVSPQLILSGKLSDVSSQDTVSPDTFTTASGLTSVTARYLEFRTLSSVYAPTRNNVGLNEIQVLADVDATPPFITVQPRDQFGAPEGITLTFTVTATGTAPLSYQWQKNAVDLPGATNSTLTLANVKPVTGGTYTVIVSNSFGREVSATAILSVAPTPVPPTITAQPQSQTVTVGGSVTFRVTAMGIATLSYQWRKDGVNLAAATNATLTLSNVTLNQAGVYTVVVGIPNVPVNGTTSDPATLTVSAPPVTPFTVVVSASPSAGGTAIVTGTANPGSSVTVIAAPANGYRFVNWTENGSIVSTSASYGFIASANRTLVANFVVAPTSTRVLQIGTGSGGPGAGVGVPITLSADGTENALSFSLAFASSQATFGGMALGSGLTGASLVVNTNQAANGQIGVVLSLPVNQTIPKGTQQLVIATFNLASPVSTGAVVPIQFASSPAPKSASDSFGGDLTVSYLDGSITVVAGYEGDVAPRSGGNNLVNAGDVTVLGRIVAGLESNLSAAEFQRADCAPRSSLGNGVINVADLTQAARYVAGLDPQTSTGGPTTSAVGLAGASVNGGTPARKSLLGTRRASVVNATASSGSTVTVVVQLNAQGDENALSFSLAFDASKLSLTGASSGSGAPGASLVVNTNLASSGKLGVVISMPVNQSLAPGNLELLKLNFVAGNVAGNAAVGFSNSPAPESVSDALGNDLMCQFVDGVITIGSGSQSLPVIIAQPASVSAGLGGSATLSVSATGAATYQWQLNGKDIPGAIGPVLLLNNLAAEAAGLYTVVIGNSTGRATSTPAALSLLSINVYPGLTIIGPVGTRYRIDYALDANAASWTVLTNLTLPVSPYLFSDGTAPASTRRFYRAVPQP